MSKKWVLIVAALLVPVWWIGGRLALGSVGWFWIASILFFPVLLAPLVLTVLRCANKAPLTLQTALPLWAMDACYCLTGLFMPDCGDMNDAPSVFTVLTGLPVPLWLPGLFAFVALLLVLLEAVNLARRPFQ